MELTYDWLVGHGFRLLLPYIWKHWLLFGEVYGVTFLNRTMFYETEEVCFNLTPHLCKTTYQLKVKVGSVCYFSVNAYNHVCLARE